jgi:hypothetical protein
VAGYVCEEPEEGEEVNQGRKAARLIPDSSEPGMSRIPFRFSSTNADFLPGDDTK